MYFMGEYNHNIDAKGRVIVPAKFREALGEKFIVTKGLDGCLFVYPNDVWETVMDKLNHLPTTVKDARTFSRFMSGGAAEVETDKQGRILLTPILRKFAHLDKDVTFVGVSNRVEIWDTETYEKNMDTMFEDMDQIAENMSAIGLSI